MKRGFQRKSRFVLTIVVDVLHLNLHHCTCAETTLQADSQL